MTLWVKVLLWLAVVILPGGMLLLPVIYAMTRSERRRSDAAPDRDVTQHPDGAVTA